MAAFAIERAWDQRRFCGVALHLRWGCWLWLALTLCSSPAAEPAFPRIGMLWSDAQGREERLTKWARYGVLVVGPDSLGLRWKRAAFKDMAEEFESSSIAMATQTLATLHQRNPAAIVLCEIYYFEADVNAYPPESPWWFRDKAGKKTSFWKGCNNMAVDNADYIEHVVRRIEAVHNALGTNGGVYLDNLRFDRTAKAGWIALLDKVRAQCGAMPLMVNAGWDSDNLEWIAPKLNGIMYEDSVAHTEDKNTEAFYGRIQRHWQLLQEPRLSLNEEFGQRTNEAAMLQELERTLVYTDLFFLYSDSTQNHAHSWWREWDEPLGRPSQPPATPQPGALARRRFTGGEVLWLPANASQPARVTLEQPMRRAGAQEVLRELELLPGRGALLVKP
jgi:hypothetical protein